MIPVHTCDYGFKELSTKDICLQKYENLQKGDQEVLSICMELQTRRESRLDMNDCCVWQNSRNPLSAEQKRSMTTCQGWSRTAQTAGNCRLKILINGLASNH